MAALLTLETITKPRDYLTIDGAPYNLRRHDDLSILEHAQLQRQAPRFDELMRLSRDQMTDAQAVELGEIAAIICGVVLEAPPEVQARLSDTQRVEVALTFTWLLLGMRPTSRSQTTSTAPIAPRSRGANKPRASRASTGARRTRG